jgi:hypothetical protein
LVKQKNAFFKEYYESIIKIDTIVCAHCKAVKVRQDFPKYNPNCRECMRTDLNASVYSITDDEKNLRNRFKKDYMQYVKDKKQEALKLFNQNKPIKDCHKTDQWKLANRIRFNLRMILKGVVEPNKVINHIGCSYEELKMHLEQQWKEGMTWENYGKHGWHIDHKRPCASFELSDEKQLAICSHYSNLQPLWAHENWSKGGRTIID